MSSYRRFISYMYDCSPGQKRKNCGFLKIEIRGGRCVIFFQLNNAPCQEKCNIYFCFRNSNPTYLFFQSIPIKKGNTRYRAEMNSLNMFGSNASFSECSGVLCTDENGGNCCACWDSFGTLPVYNPVTQQTVAIETEAVSDAAKEAVSDTAKETVSEQTVETESVSSSNNDTISVSLSEMPEKKSRTFPELWDHMQKEFPAMDPFEDNAVVESIKIAPSDLGYLQACNLNLGTNQFLIHGYKCYHHLLLGRLHGHLQYVIGIPGIYDPQEQFMAKMFGFPCFKPIRESRQKNGQFGYWLRCFH